MFGGKPTSGFKEIQRIVKAADRQEARRKWWGRWGWLILTGAGFVVGWVVCKMLGG